ncbi:MAG: hypothetical protein U5L45_01095 [Saprospiraceae bacterium]|nr:hypothetical protein [Saprospiraceae bacterium]
MSVLLMGEAAPRLTGPNIISQEIEIVRRNSTGCPDYDYNISAKAVITESGLYSIEWERTTRSWNWGTESYDVSTIRVISSRYYRVKGGGVVPSFTVSKKHANIGEAIIITPSVNYTDPNSQSNEFLLTTITTNCGITDSFTERNHWLNASTPFTYQSSRSKVNLYASAIDNGCPPVKGNSQEVFF